VKIELLADAKREGGWWLLVDGSEQSYVDVADPLHLEFEYVQMVAHVLDACFPTAAALAALHLGGGLCTLPRWVAARHPGSRQRVAEHSKRIARLAESLGEVPGVTLEVADAIDVVGRARRRSTDVVVCDVYDGPETVTVMFTAGMAGRVRGLLRPGGVYVANLSDAAPFAMSRVVAATLCSAFGSVAVLAEPPVLRGRRSGNLVLAATDTNDPTEVWADVARRAAGGAVRSRVLVGEELEEFIGDAAPVESEAELPPSGESGRAWFQSHGVARSSQP
jgi:spermidine synthase